MQARHAATVGLARAVLHYTGAPARGPAFLNEGLPLVMAEISTPKAGIDAVLRRKGLQSIRAGGLFAPLVRSNYSDAVWTDDPGLARAESYLLVHWLWDKGPERVLRFAKDSTAWGAPGSDPLETRFAKSFGMTIDAACAQAQRWFQTND
jgi:hypothetical protein